MHRILPMALLLVLSAAALGATFTVTNCAAAKETHGSLAWALDEARKISLPEISYVDFNIPSTEAGYITTEVSGIGFWRIQPEDASAYDLNRDSIAVRGSTQTSNQGDRNPYGPEIEIEGTNLSASNPLFKIDANNECTLEGMILCNSKTHAIHVSLGNEQHIFGCYLGTNATGEVARANAGAGIYLDSSGGSVIGGISGPLRNLISGNAQNGIELNNSTAVQMLNNYVGTNRTGMRSLPNTQNGVKLTNNSGVNGANFIGGAGAGRNLISGNAQNGILIDGNSTINQVLNNYIGTDTTGAGTLGNGVSGINVAGGANRQYIAQGNVIAFNQADGARIEGASTLYNTLTQNSFFSNTGKGISLLNSGNGGITPPSLATSEYFSSFNIFYVQGQGPASSIIEILKVEAPEVETQGEGKKTVGFGVADTAGNWFAYLSTNEVQAGDKITALATDRNGNTSEFAQNILTVTGTIIYRPDGMIGILADGTDYVGENIFNTTGDDQQKQKSIMNSQGAIYYIKVKNSGNISPDNILMTGTGASTDWQVKYFDSKTGSNEITAQVTNSGYISTAIPSAESAEFRMEVVSTGTALSTKEVWVTLASASNPGRRDVVRAVTVASPPIPTDRFYFEIVAPATAEAGTEFKLSLIARDQTGRITTEVVGKSYFTVDEGTVSLTSVEASEFSYNGTWNGALSLSTVGTRVLSVSNSFIQSVARATILVNIPQFVASGGLMRFGPNPYNPGIGQNAVFWYWLNGDRPTSIYIFDLNGNSIFKQAYAAGSNGAKNGLNMVSWNGKNSFGETLENGIYFYRVVREGKAVYSGKIIILK